MGQGSRYPSAVSEPGAPERVVRPPWGLGAAAVAFVVGYLLAAVAGGLAVAGGAGTYDTVTVTLSLVGLWIGFAGVPFFLSRTRGSGRLAEDFGLRIGGPGDVGLGIAGGLVAYALLEGYSVILRQFDHVDLGKGTDKLAGHGLGLGFVVFAVAVAIGAPIVEELFFRGLVQPGLQRRAGGLPGLLLTAALFGLLHVGDNPIEAALPLAVFGVVVGALAWRTGRLGPGIVAHVTFNGITVVALALSR
ncbi:MAG: hypothetical protein NVSMB12_13040 [Acidimicrobiales bacterium]